VASLHVDSLANALFLLCTCGAKSGCTGKLHRASGIIGRVDCHQSLVGRCSSWQVRGLVLALAGALVVLCSWSSVGVCGC
jgi:hypothetical protein